jgi:hypothetical protein
VVRIGQQEVYDFLTQHKGKWFTSRDISEQLKVSIGSVTMSLKKLRKTNLIKYKNTGIRNTFIYTVEPEGVTVQAPPGVPDREEPEPRQRPSKPEKIMPKIVVPKKQVPISVPRHAVAKPKKARNVRPKPAQRRAPKSRKVVKRRTRVQRPIRRKVRGKARTAKRAQQRTKASRARLRKRRR